ncbi:fkbM_fam, methyltransferase, FkbM family [uncultured Caudovirales phage]|uniref:FkbM_fam, methyltransferase, FkbM family n=1 Tax=uncultured Caudovirales phage TaxID=2100421 RepID=A0A6J5S386_9CAUD|nr:fkbM_fam, methyltransferase, FkbM family [uncultured Caudovirales phage]CAB4202348.1 fkbM_fam, methyltransferase, FkbM family [uncultured Caudovirales phage]CAB4214519.1 fkbM_fam, methyltransferase, FkbM family [uncultured Caudovirales phage]CAB5228886.1 fkbM_fam, methyltransferase, FkbM family [uncultured Caudovirales phage]
MLLFDIGANRGDAVVAGLNQGYTVIAIEPSRIYSALVKTFIYDSRVTPLRCAVSDTNDQLVEFYEAEEDGLSTLNKEWLTSSKMPYNGKPYTVRSANTITIDALAGVYGEPDLIKIDVEGAEWSVLKGMIRAYGVLTFEWTLATIKEHQKQLNYLAGLGYTHVAPQFIEHHLQTPSEWHSLSDFDFRSWHALSAPSWEAEGWKASMLRPTADVGMVWVSRKNQLETEKATK